jgi:phenylpropionate dioxygenase-like ring-hydroxylating dioxygenase large terminal subunit
MNDVHMRHLEEKSMAYLKNAWTIAAWSSELAPGQLLARTFLSEPVVMYRDAGGLPHALHDRCPHRFAPLSTGHLRDNNAIECGYHGLRFGAEGRCVLNPHGDGAIPKAASVRHYPLVERWSALWIWMGDPTQADATLIPQFNFLDPALWGVGTGSMLVEAPYELEIDNILDLSHIEFMHPLLGSAQVRNAEIACTQEGDKVWSKRFVRDETDVSPLVRKSFNIPEGPMDRWMNVRWEAPANMAMWAGGVVSGRPPEQGVEAAAAHCFTPENEHSTHYFFAIAFPRSMGPHAEALAQEAAVASSGPFEYEDKPMLEAVARRMNGADLWSLNPVLLPGDAAAIRARRLLTQQIAREQADQRKT